MTSFGQKRGNRRGHSRAGRHHRSLHRRCEGPGPCNLIDQPLSRVDANRNWEPDRPIGVIGIGHSWMTGYMSDPKLPGADAEANSWATGTNPEVRSIYLRLVAARPETAGHVVNAADNGATSDLLPDQASKGLARVPYPALVIVQIVGNDLRCDGTDPEHYAEFRASVRRAVQTVVKASPKASVVLVGDPGRPTGYAAAIATLPTTPKSFIDNRPCFLFSGNRTVNRAEVARVTNLLAAYEAQLAKACAGIRQCHTDGGAAARMEVHVADYGERPPASFDTGTRPHSGRRMARDRLSPRPGMTAVEIDPSRTPRGQYRCRQRPHLPLVAR